MFTSPLLLWHNANFTCNEIELTDVEKSTKWQKSELFFVKI